MVLLPLMSSVLSSLLASAPVEPLATDRPDIAESASVLAPLSYQLEQGVANELGRGGFGVFGFPSLHRLGIGARFELRLETPLMELSSAGVGAPDIAFGLKWNFLEGGDWGQAPSMAVLAHAEFQAAGGSVPVLKLLLDYSLPFSNDLGFNAGVTSDGSTAVLLGALAISHSFTDTFRAYLEGSFEEPVSGVDRVVGVDAGVALLLTNDVQLDAAVYKGLTPAAPVWSVGLGLSIRFNHPRG